MPPSMKPIPSKMSDEREALPRVEKGRKRPAFDYQEAFCRNSGLISVQDQAKLRNTRVAIAGMGGVGGLHLVTLARLGIGKFTIADPDRFELANMNRQQGCRTDTVGRSKVEVMSEDVRRINPEIDLRFFDEPIGENNAAHFLRDADLLVDGLDLFAVNARRHVFRTAAEQGLYTVTAGPVGFSTAWIVFSPEGMSFDRYFDLSDEMDAVQMILAFLLGASPKATQLAYMDLQHMDIHAKTAPSATLGCQLAAGVAAAESLKILLGKGKVRPAPWYHQFDAHLGAFVSKKLRWGNRHPWQLLKRWWLYRQYRTGTACWAKQSTGSEPPGTTT